MRFERFKYEIISYEKIQFHARFKGRYMLQMCIKEIVNYFFIIIRVYLLLFSLFLIQKSEKSTVTASYIQVHIVPYSTDHTQNISLSFIPNLTELYYIITLFIPRQK